MRWDGGIETSGTVKDTEEGQGVDLIEVLERGVLIDDVAEGDTTNGHMDEVERGR